jgi:hypothetical protein
MGYRFILAVCVSLAIGTGEAIAQSGPPVCKVAQLGASEEPGASLAALGHVALTIAARNRSSSACRLEGMPDLGFLDKANLPLPVHVCADCPAYLFPGLPVLPVVLNPGQSAYIVIGYIDVDGDEGCKAASALILRPAKQRKSLKIKLGEMRSCGLVNVTPFLASPLHLTFPGRAAAMDAEKSH